MEKGKKPYQKPTIARQSIGLMNMFGRVTSSTPYSQIDGVPVRELVENYGSPLWVVSEGTLRRKYKDMYRAFSLRYPRVQIAYSYKTNFLSGICAILHQEGAWAEVVSGFEYDIAMALGVPGEKIVFNGPHKRREELSRAVEQGARINIDSYDELYTLEEMAREQGKRVGVGVRLNMTIGYPAWDRFGFNYESGQALEACQRVISSDSLRLVGLHVHVGTFIQDVNVYQQMAEKLINFCHLLPSEVVSKLEYLDIGGGYASKNTLHSQWTAAEYATPTFEQYADAICPTLLRNPPKFEDPPLLIMEPGRALVDEAMYLLSTVVAKKTSSTGNKMAVIDAGVNLLPSCYWYRYDMFAAQNSASLGNGGVMEDVNIYGPLCMQIDALRLGVSLPPLGKGDILVIKNVGAYNFSQSMQFIQPRPAIVLVNTEGEVEHLRLPETTEYIRQLERVPQRLMDRKG